VKLRREKKQIYKVYSLKKTEKRKEEKERNVDVFYIRKGRRRKEGRCCEMRDSRFFIRTFYR
jgi:hypothetical protein